MKTTAAVREAMRREDDLEVIDCDLKTAKRIVKTLCRELRIRRPKVVYKQTANDDCYGLYELNRERINIYPDGANVDTVLHELAHHMQCVMFRKPLKGGWHGAAFTVCFLAIVKLYRERY